MPGNLTSIDNNEWPYSPEFQEFANFLGLPAEKDSKGINWPHSNRVAEKLEEIYAWGKAKAESNDITNVKIKIKSLQEELGEQSEGETLVRKLWEYIRLSTKRDQIDKELNLLKK